jgi:hypothetical protein
MGVECALASFEQQQQLPVQASLRGYGLALQPVPVSRFFEPQDVLLIGLGHCISFMATRHGS